MKTLKEYWNKEKKEKIYKFYKNIINDYKEYEKVTRNDMYNSIISLYKNDPEIILKLCSIEEIQILEYILKGNKIIDNGGYIEHIVYKNLKNNYLIIGKDNCFIPNDIFNYVKMALNMFDEKIYSLKDVTDSVLIGLSRIYNVVKIDDFLNLLSNYYINMQEEDLKQYLKNNPRVSQIMKITKYKKEEYVISLENNFYQDILDLKEDYYNYKIYSLEETISVGKYKINLFKEEIFKYLSFLETHLEPDIIESLLNDIIIYAGFDISEEEDLKSITGNVDILLKETKTVINHFPIWIYKGNEALSLKQNIILPNKNEPCLCGSGRKFKKCCYKKYKK